jgi:hypothetical protein
MNPNKTWKGNLKVLWWKFQAWLQGGYYEEEPDLNARFDFMEAQAAKRVDRFATDILTDDTLSKEQVEDEALLICTNFAPFNDWQVKLISSGGFSQLTALPLTAEKIYDFELTCGKMGKAIVVIYKDGDKGYIKYSNPYKDNVYDLKELLL